jgi:hypothetical protein
VNDNTKQLRVRADRLQPGDRLVDSYDAVVADVLTEKVEVVLTTWPPRHIKGSTRVLVERAADAPKPARRKADVVPTPHEHDPVGISDIARRLSLAVNTVAVYKTRGLLPEPRWFVSQVPAWCWQCDIQPTLVDGRFSKMAAS